MRSLGAVHVLAAMMVAGCEPVEQRVAMPTAVSVPAETWVRIPTPEPLMVPAYSGQLCIAPAGAVTIGRETFDLRTQAGQAFTPTLVAVGAGGRVDTLSTTGLLGDRWLCAMTPVDAALDTPYVQVRLWSPVPFSIDSLYWHSVDK